MPNSSRETKVLGANVDREISTFPFQLTTCRIGNFTRLINTLAIRVTIHTYISGVYLVCHIYIYLFIFPFLPIFQPLLQCFQDNFVGIPLLTNRSTAMGPQKYKNENKKLFISAAILSVFSFLYVPRYRLGE